MPSNLILEYPRQKTNQNIFSFHEEFEDYVHLRNMILSSSENMSSPNMIDTFILCCHNTEYLKHASRYDRDDPKRQSWFEPGTLALTCNTYLQSAPKHLLLKTDQRSHHDPNENKYRSSTPSNGGRDTADNNKYRNHSNPYAWKKVHSLLDINDDGYKIPDSGINKVVAQLATADPKDPICLLCRDETNPHRWTDCLYIKDAEFNKSVSIRLATVLNRTMKESQKRNPTNTKQLHALLHDTHSSNDESPSDEDIAKQDFPKGDK